MPSVLPYPCGPRWMPRERPDGRTRGGSAERRVGGTHGRGGEHSRCRFTCSPFSVCQRVPLDRTERLPQDARGRPGAGPPGGVGSEEDCGAKPCKR